MPYSKTTWVNNVTPLNATNMNHIEDGIGEAMQEAADNTTNIGDLSELETEDKSNIVNAINEQRAIPYTDSEIDDLLGIEA